MNDTDTHSATAVPLEPARRLAVRSLEAAQMLGISRSTLYHLMADREIEWIKLGRNRLILVASLENLIERRRRLFAQFDIIGGPGARRW